MAAIPAPSLSLLHSRLRPPQPPHPVFLELPSSLPTHPATTASVGERQRQRGGTEGRASPRSRRAGPPRPPDTAPLQRYTPRGTDGAGTASPKPAPVLLLRQRLLPAPLERDPGRAGPSPTVPRVQLCLQRPGRCGRARWLTPTPHDTNRRLEHACCLAFSGTRDSFSRHSLFLGVFLCVPSAPLRSEHRSSLVRLHPRRCVFPGSLAGSRTALARSRRDCFC